MEPSSCSIGERVVHPDDRVFEIGLRALASRVTGSEAEEWGYYSVVFERISASSSSLEAVKIDRRVAQILEHAPRSKEFLHALGRASAAYAPVVKNAIVRFLPPELKRLPYGRLDCSKADGLRTSPEHQDAVPLAPQDTQGDSERPVVLLLGGEREQESNSRLLDRNGFLALRVSSLDRFDDLLSPETCGIVVGRSWWTRLPNNEHRAFIQKLLSHSSFIWLKLDLSGCVGRQHVHEDCHAARYRHAEATDLSLGETSIIDEGLDLPGLRQAESFIRGSSRISLWPADLDTKRAQILTAGLEHHVRSRAPSGGYQLEKVATKTLEGGLSGALIVWAHPDDGGLPLIVKFDSIGFLREEMQRFREFIIRWDNALHPRLHYHDSTAAIIFGLIDSPGSQLKPAPTLESTLRQVLQVESGGLPKDLPEERDLSVLLERTVAKICELNQRRCHTDTFPSRAWVNVGPLDRMLEHNIQWRLPPLYDGRDPLALRSEAERILTGTLQYAATVHGDIHLRNILVRDYREPFLIDYSYAGPGHPCYDLVRLESSLLFRIFRMTADEARMRSLLRYVSTTATTMEVLLQQFPDLCGSIGNRLAVQVAIGVRERCLMLLREYGGEVKEYFAMKLVVACQALADQQVQTGVVRAALHVASDLLSQQLAEHHSVGVSLSNGKLHKPGPRSVSPSAA